mmetsp:Transcript_29664/g.50887  ORF Transcript_29664/g.50887 Transcript_29664/m.50887 type:complete len:200 (-) Transcript_29664:441-1040(-)
MRHVLGHGVLVRLDLRGAVQSLVACGHYLDVVLVHAVCVLHAARLAVQGGLDSREVVAEAERVDGVGHIELVKGEGDQVHQIEQARILSRTARRVTSGLVKLLVGSNVKVARAAVQVKTSVQLATTILSELLIHIGHKRFGRALDDSVGLEAPAHTLVGLLHVQTSLAALTWTASTVAVAASSDLLLQNSSLLYQICTL